MLALLPVAVALGLDNFAAAIAIGLAGVGARTRLRVGVVFGVFEAGMPIVGLLIGAQAAASLGPRRGGLRPGCSSRSAATYSWRACATRTPRQPGAAPNRPPGCCRRTAAASRAAPKGLAGWCSLAWR